MNSFIIIPTKSKIITPYITSTKKISQNQHELKNE